MKIKILKKFENTAGWIAQLTSVRVSHFDHFPTNLHSFNHYHAIIFQNVWSYFLPETYFAQNSGTCRLIKGTVIQIEKQLINYR